MFECSPERSSTEQEGDDELRGEGRKAEGGSERDAGTSPHHPASVPGAAIVKDDEHAAGDSTGQRAPRDNYPRLGAPITHAEAPDGCFCPEGDVAPEPAEEQTVRPLPRAVAKSPPRAGARGQLIAYRSLKIHIILQKMVPVLHTHRHTRVLWKHEKLLLKTRRFVLGADRAAGLSRDQIWPRATSPTAPWRAASPGKSRDGEAASPAAQPAVQKCALGTRPAVGAARESRSMQQKRGARSLLLFLPSSIQAELTVSGFKFSSFAM